MKKKTFSIMLMITFIVSLAFSTQAQMASDNYRIPTSVLSGGGAPASSDSYQINNTLGQPSPLMDPNYPPYSTNYDLYPGFWYTIWIGFDFCLGDCDHDGDVDGSDLAAIAADSGLLDLSVFAIEFGRTDCPIML